MLHFYRNFAKSNFESSLNVLKIIVRLILNPLAYFKPSNIK